MPGRIVSCFKWCPLGYMSILDLLRQDLEQFASVSAVVLALASNCWLLLWVVGPEDGNWWGHTALFVFYAAGSYLTCLGNFLEVRFSSRAHVIERQHKIFIGCYTFAVVFLPFCYATNLALYKEGQPPALPPWVTQASDVVWLGCVMFITSFTPPDVPLRQTMELATERDVEAQRML